MTIQELEQCILLYGKDIYSFCMHLAKEKESADDLYQDAFLEATKKIASIRYEDNPKSYLLSIVIRLWKNRVRKRAWRSRIAPQVAEEAAIGILVVGSASAYAAYRYLTPSQVADQMTEDGTPMPGQMDDSYQTFCVSALIHGKSFMDVNNGTLGAGAQAFTLDEKTGDYEVNKAFDGMQALFMLPLDKSKADDKAAEKYFTQIEEQKDDENAAAQNETDEMAGKEQIEKRLDGAKLIESETKTVTPDEDVTFTYQAYRPAKAQLK